MLSRSSPVGGGLGPNKTVAFSKPTDPGESLAASPFTRTGPEFGNNAVPSSAGQHQRTLRTSPRFRAEGLMVPPASDAATLRRQVAALQIDLEAHIDGEQRLQSINQQLRERLEVYMKQNHENVERAESELNTLHEDMEQTLELQRRLAQRATALENEKKDIEAALQRRVQEFENERTSLQTRIQSMGEDLRAKAEAQEKVNLLQAELLSTLDVKDKLEERLELFSKEAVLLKKRADDCSHELRDLILKEQLDQKLDTMGRNSVIRRALLHFQIAVREQFIDRANTEHARNLYRHHCRKKLLCCLRVATHRASVMRRAIDRHCKFVFHACWRMWKLTTVAGRMGDKSLERKSIARMTHSIHVWIAYVIRLRLSPERYAIAVSHWDRKCLQTYFERWSRTLRFWRLGAKEEKLLTGKAIRHFTSLLLRYCYDSWKDWLKAYARPKRKKFATVQAHINKMTMRQALAAWRCIIYVRWVCRMKFEEAVELSKISCIKRSFRRWQKGIGTVKFNMLYSSQAIAFRSFRTGRSAFGCWRNFLQLSMHMRIYKKMASRHYLHKLSVKSMQIWRENVNYKKAQQRATAEVNQALTRAAMVFWRDYHLYESIKKKKDYRAAIHIKRKQTKLATRILGFWWEQVAWKRKAMQLDNLLAVRRHRTLLIQSLHVWLYATFDGLLLANAKFHEDLLESQALFEEQKHQVTTVDVENLQLIDRLHSMSAEVAFLKTTISDKVKQVENLHRALEDGVVLESTMRGEIEQQHLRCQEIECEIHGLQKRLQMKNAEETAGDIHHTLEIQNLEQTLKELRIQLADKSSQIDSYEKALKETAERLEGASDESQEKLTSAFEIAGSLRKLLEDRESQFATLEGNCRRRELKLGEMQRKLAVANCTLCETVECRDSQIQELETMLCSKQQEAEEMQQQLQNMELAIDSKESRVRKLVYEIKLMSEQAAVKTKPCVSNLNSWSPAPLDSDNNASLQGGSLSVKASMRTMRNDDSNTLQQQSITTCFEGQISQIHQSCACESKSPSITNVEGQQFGDMPSQNEVLFEPMLCLDNSYELTHLQDDSSPPLAKPPDAIVGRTSHQSELGASSCFDERAEMNLTNDTHRQTSETLDQDSRSVFLYQGLDMMQPDWEKSFSIVSTGRLTAPGHMVKPGSCSLKNRQEQEQGPLDAAGGGAGVRQTAMEGPYIMTLDDDPNAVDNLHLEIQRLQTRIMSRLRDSTVMEDPSTRSGSGVTSRAVPDASPGSRRMWDSR